MACKKKDETINGKAISYIQEAVLVPTIASPATNIINLSYNYPEQQYNTNENISAFSKAIASEINLSVVPPSYNNLSFIQKVEVYILADSLPARRIAIIDVMPDNYTQRDVTIFTTEADCIAYLKKPNFNFQVRYIANQNVNENIYCKLFVNFMGQ